MGRMERNVGRGELCALGSVPPTCLNPLVWQCLCLDTIYTPVYHHEPIVEKRI